MPSSTHFPLPSSLHELLAHRRVLLLQGPMGPFFADLAAYLEARGQAVSKVNFNGGDTWFYRRPGALAFTGTPEQWSDWLRSLLARQSIDAIVLFGQTRPLHAAALELARKLGIATYVFEEGYLRPDYVTLERGGVNVHSSLPRNLGHYRQMPARDEIPVPRPTGQRFGRMALLAIQYFVASWLARPWFPGHQYHRSLNPLAEATRWLRGGWRKLAYGWRQRNLLALLKSPERSKRWFLLPLQVANDSQIVHHSRFDSVSAVIKEVVISFARHSRTDEWLVIKHHPMDRPYSDYSALIRREVQRLGLQGRVLYVHDLHLPTLLKHCRGVITVNSTTGLQALYHQAPVCTLADSFYSIPGLVHRGPLAHFWKQPGKVNLRVYLRFHHEVVARTQLNASFYAAAPAFAAGPVPDASRLRLLRTETQAMPQGAARSWQSVASNEEAMGQRA